MTQLRCSSGQLFACTRDGLYRKASDTPDSAWVLLGFAGQKVLDVLRSSPDTLIVARDITGTGADTVAIWRSVDGGSTWSPYQNGFGADGGSGDRRVIGLLSPAPATIVAASLVRIGKSTDGGVTWKKVISDYGPFVFLTSGGATLWAGGENNLMTAFAMRSVNVGDSWTNAFGTGNDDVARSMAFDPSDPDHHAFVGTAWGIYQTTTGTSWTSVPPPVLGIGARAMGTRAFAPLRLYVGGMLADEPTVYRTDDLGSTWTRLTFSGFTHVQPLAMLVRSGAVSDTLFLGTANGALRYIETAIVGVPGNASSDLFSLRANPVPFSSRTVISFDLPRASTVSLRVLDLTGREVASLLEGVQPAGPHDATWDAGGMPSGLYLLLFQAGASTASRKVCHLR